MRLPALLAVLSATLVATSAAGADPYDAFELRERAAAFEHRGDFEAAATLLESEAALDGAPEARENLARATFLWTGLDAAERAERVGRDFIGRFARRHPQEATALALLLSRP